MYSEGVLEPVNCGEAALRAAGRGLPVVPSRMWPPVRTWPRGTLRGCTRARPHHTFLAQGLGLSRTPIVWWQELPTE